MNNVRTGDLVIHVPADGSRGSGPFYVDDGESNPDVVTVSLLVCGPAAWTFGLPRHEVEVVGNYKVSYSHRLVNAFTRAALRKMQPVIERGKARFYERFPTFQDGRTEVRLTELSQSAIRSGFIVDCPRPPLTVPDQTVYAVPRDGARTHLATTEYPDRFWLTPPWKMEHEGHYVELQRD